MDQVVDDRFLALLSDTASRGVRIYLEWGYRMRAAKLHEHEVRAIERLKQLHRTLPERQLRLCNSPTHVKEISVDDETAVIGSFNWLSNASRGAFSNRERSLVYQRASLAHDIRLDAELAWENWKYVP